MSTFLGFTEWQEMSLTLFDYFWVGWVCNFQCWVCCTLRSVMFISVQHNFSEGCFCLTNVLQHITTCSKKKKKEAKKYFSYLWKTQMKLHKGKKMYFLKAFIRSVQLSPMAVLGLWGYLLISCFWSHAIERVMVHVSSHPFSPSTVLRVSRVGVYTTLPELALW